MIRPWRPSAAEIASQLRVVDPPFSYPEVGATADRASIEAIAGQYDVDRYRFPLGTGRPLFERARASLLAWRHFDVPWVELQGAAKPASPGQVVATLTRVLGLWFLSPCRVVYAEERENVAAFAYGTLAGHVERGEERFTLHCDPRTEQVGYEILAFSRPALLLSKLGYRWARRVQKRFARASADALARACAPTSEPG